MPVDILLFAFNAGHFGIVAFEQVEGDVAQDLEIFRVLFGHTPVRCGRGHWPIENALHWSLVSPWAKTNPA